RFEVELLAQRVVQIFFFAIHERREPNSRLNVGAPAVEIKIPAGVSAAAVGTVEANDVETLILNPDAACEASFAVFSKRGDVKNEATHFPEEFAVNVVEFVVLLIKAVGIDENHLQESIGQILHCERKEIADGAENPFALAVGVGKGDESDALLKIGAAKEILVAAGHVA